MITSRWRFMVDTRRVCWYLIAVRTAHPKRRGDAATGQGFPAVFARKALLQRLQEIGYRRVAQWESATLTR